MTPPSDGGWTPPDTPRSDADGPGGPPDAVPQPPGRQHTGPQHTPEAAQQDAQPAAPQHAPPHEPPPAYGPPPAPPYGPPAAQQDMPPAEYGPPTAPQDTEPAAPSYGSPTASQDAPPPAPPYGSSTAPQETAPGVPPYGPSAPVPPPYGQPYGAAPGSGPYPVPGGEYGPPQGRDPRYPGVTAWPPPGVGGYAHGPRAPWLVAPEPGTPFHRMARTAAHRWWRPLVATLAGAGVYLVVGFVVLFVFMLGWAIVTNADPETISDGDDLFGDPTADVAFNLLVIALLLPVMVLAAVVQRRRPGTLFSVLGRVRWRWLAACAGAAALFCVVSFALSLAAQAVAPDDGEADGSWVGWGAFVGPAIVIVLLVPFQSTAEEVTFRGWILQAVGAWTLETRTGRVARAFSRVLRTPWPGIAIGSALFASAHGYTGWGVLDIFAFGAVAAWLAVRTGGLEAGIAMHVLNNLMAFLLPAAFGELSLDQGGVPFAYVAADIAAMLIYAGLVLLLARRMNVARVTPGEPERPPIEITWQNAQDVAEGR
ncbi:type II CAAX prenyl endopeptidase Rce1 family protein [Actinomadura atramentaria]|uniref:CPBP family glutamic-type intramembrane protease n=1 Tax=Actinomadura atramentaria TaxID=1990 RepID=UPI00037612D6|nr:CPBP family glutamic-type intramembrane protease [Actinomadura atramentaria]